jgi:hypothetical protein
MNNFMALNLLFLEVRIFTVPSKQITGVNTGGLQHAEIQRVAESGTDTGEHLVYREWKMCSYRRRSRNPKLSILRSGS